METIVIDPEQSIIMTHNLDMVFQQQTPILDDLLDEDKCWVF